MLALTGNVLLMSKENKDNQMNGINMIDFTKLGEKDDTRMCIYTNTTIPVVTT